MITYPLIEKTDIEETLMLSISLLGENYHERSYFEQVAENQQAYLAKSGNQIVGFITFRAASKEGFYNKCGHVIQAPSGLIDAIGVHQTYQKQGIGNRLLQLALAPLEKEFPQIVSLGWKFNDHVNVEKLFLKNGFKELKEIHHLWEKECHSGGFSCHVKEQNNCICSAVLYKKIIVE